MSINRFMRIVITHMSSDENRGDFAILRATVIGLQRQFAHGRLASMSAELPSPLASGDGRVASAEGLGVEVLGTPVPSLARSGQRLMAWVLRCVRAEVWIWTSAARRKLGLRPSVPGWAKDAVGTIGNADAVVAKGGSYLYAHKGFREHVFLWRMLYLLRFASTLGRPCVLFGVSLGPYDTRIARVMTARVLNRCAAVFVREHLSEAVARDLLRLRAPIRLVPDIALAVSDAGRRGTARPRIGITARRIPFAREGELEIVRQNYERALAGLVEYVGQKYPNYDTVMITQVDEDEIYYRSLRDRYRELRGVVVITPPDLASLLDEYASLAMLVGTRLHSVLLAAVVGTPAVHVAYERQKGVGLMETLGAPDRVVMVEDVTTDFLANAVDEILVDRDRLSEALRDRVGGLRAEINCAFTELTSFVGSRSD